MLRQDIEEITAHVKSQNQTLQHNHILFDIYEGSLLPYIEQDLRNQLSPSSYAMAKNRIPPINVLKRLVDKVSKIYQQRPSRMVQDGSDSDSELLAWYEMQMMLDQKLNISNEFFNLFKSSLVEVFLHNGTPSIRSIPNDRFTVWSNDAVDPTNPTHFIVVDDVKRLKDGTSTMILRVYTDDEFVIVDDRGEIQHDRMEAIGNPDGINPFGIAPFVYVNRSQNLLIPKEDTDTLKMTKLFPVLLADLNFAVMFQSFSILYGIDIDDENLEMAPNAFWRFKSDPTTEAKPELGQIKPQVDIQQTLSLIQAQLAFWLQSRGIRPGSVGELTSDNFSSGVSKMIDEMDSSEERQKQVKFYQDGESKLWDMVFNRMHPYWVATGQIENRAIFTPTAHVVTSFHDQLPLTRRGEVVKDLESEVQAGFTSVRRAIKKLNPEMTEESIDELIIEMDVEKSIPFTAQESDDVLAEDEN